MQKWEYLEVYQDFNTGYLLVSDGRSMTWEMRKFSVFIKPLLGKPGNMVTECADRSDSLNQLGREGWELVGVTFSATLSYFFKRPLD